MLKKITAACLSVLLVLTLFGCSSSFGIVPRAATAAPSMSSPTPVEPAPKPEASAEATVEAAPVTILLAAAASLENTFKNELIPLFESKNPDITVDATYDSSGKLQTQIEEGLPADVFMSAATKQMDTLANEGMIASDSVVNLLENRIVMIAPVSSNIASISFAQIASAPSIALGDPESVPAGQYAKEALTNLGVWDEAAAKASFGTNVTEVLAWVSEGSADVGIVYKTDAASTKKVRILSEAPEGSLKTKVIYPVGIVSASDKKQAAQRLVDFLKSPEAIAIFGKYGFASAL